MLTEIQWKKITDLQTILDERILTEKGLVSSDTINSRFLALLVELGEFTNKQRCFKYWSNKLAEPKIVLLDEYIDCLHFLISLSISLEIDLKIYQFKKLEQELLDLIIMTFSQTIKVQKEQNQANFYLLYDYFFNIAIKLGWTADDIYNAYLLKNNTNHKRQDNNY